MRDRVPSGAVAWTSSVRRSPWRRSFGGGGGAAAAALRSFGRLFRGLASEAAGASADGPSSPA